MKNSRFYLKNLNTKLHKLIIYKHKKKICGARDLFVTQKSHKMQKIWPTKVFHELKEFSF